MITGTLPAQSRRATYADALELKDSETGDAIAWTGVVSGEVRLCKMGTDCALVSKSLNAGLTLPADGIIAWQFEPSDLSALPEVHYRLLVLLTMSTGQVVEILDAVLPLS